MKKGRRPRDPNKGHNIVSIRVSDFAYADIRKMVKQTGKSRAEIARLVIYTGLPKVKAELLKEP